MLKRAARVLFWANDHNLLPASFIRDDSMYTGAFIANLGSLGMDAGFHHLYEWGNCPIFVMVGAVHDAAVVEDGQVVAARVMNLRFTYDERVEDGLAARQGFDIMLDVLEDPERFLGCLDPDASTHPSMLDLAKDAQAARDDSMTPKTSRHG